MYLTIVCQMGGVRYHTHTVCGLLHADFRAPSLDYRDLLELIFRLSEDAHEVAKMYQLAVFNVLSHNRDDHAKNFTFLMSGDGRWTVSPAYDLTLSSGPYGRQSTMVMGEGYDPAEEYLMSLAKSVGVEERYANQIIDRTKESLSRWPILAEEYGVSKANIQLVKNKLS